MKKLTASVLVFVFALILMASCRGYETCPTYANRNHVPSVYGKKINTEVRKGHKTRIW